MEENQFNSLSLSNSSFRLNASNEVTLNQTIYQLKIILVGDSNVGKTSLVNRFMGYDFNSNDKCTLTADFKIRSISISSNIGAELKIWDTCGQERFRSMTKQYFKDANGIVLVYDVGDINTYNNLSSWMKDIKNNANRDPEIILVANKIDIKERNVSKETGMKFAEKHKIMYIETSSKEGINIEIPFEKLANALVDKIKKDPNYKISAVGDNNKLGKNREKDVKCC